MAFGRLKETSNAGERTVPRHIAIIMDGNGRWAKKRGMPRPMGHRAGSETFRRIATYCRQIGVQYLTVYAFSTENWKRAEDEVSAIMGPVSYTHLATGRKAWATWSRMSGVPL